MPLSAIIGLMLMPLFLRKCERRLVHSFFNSPVASRMSSPRSMRMSAAFLNQGNRITLVKVGGRDKGEWFMLAA